MSQECTLSQQRLEFGRQRLLAMPIAGAIVWTIAGICGAILPTIAAAWAMFISVGMVFGLGVLIGKLIGEDVINKGKMSDIDKLFMTTIAMSNLVWAIVIPFFMKEPTSLPLGLGVLSCLMWLPMSWIIQHWVGTFHAVTRTVLIVIAWHLFPSQRFVVIPAIVVGVYLVSIYVLAARKLPTS